MNFDVSALAALARIQLSPAEKAALQQDLEKILEYVAQINALDLKQVPPLSHVLDIENVFREDKIAPQPEIARRVLDALPPDAKEGPFFKVPKIIEGIE